MTDLILVTEHACVDHNLTHTRGQNWGGEEFYKDMILHCMGECQRQDTVFSF